MEEELQKQYEKAVGKLMSINAEVRTLQALTDTVESAKELDNGHIAAWYHTKDTREHLLVTDGGEKWIEVGYGGEYEGNPVVFASRRDIQDACHMLLVQGAPQVYVVHNHPLDETDKALDMIPSIEDIELWSTLPDRAIPALYTERDGKVRVYEKIK